jgi:hypothetical protein
MYTGDKLSWVSWACFAFTVCSLLFTYHSGFDKVHEEWDEVSSEFSTHTLGGKESGCHWTEGSPVLYHLNTKLGVNYEGDHWFHIAENFMTQHSVLEASKRNTDSKVIYFDFDRSGFVAETNGMTKFMIALGVTKVPPIRDTTDTSSGGTSNNNNNNDKEYHFIHDSGIDLDYNKEKDKKQEETFHLLDHHDLHDHVKLTLRSGSGSGSGSGGETKERFLVKEGVDAHNDHESHEKVCVKDMGVIGGDWPTPQRGHWFPNDHDIDLFRKKIELLCPADPALLLEEAKKKKYKLVVYQRDLSRTIANEEEALALIGEQLKPEEWEVKVLMHARDRSPCELAHRLHNVDVMITPHGFQSMLLIFLPRPSLLFEVFPYRYYKRGYGPLGNEYGLLHYGVMSPALSWSHRLALSQTVTSSCMLGKQCRNFARNDNVHLTRRGVDRLVDGVQHLLSSAGVETQDTLYHHHKQQQQQ